MVGGLHERYAQLGTEVRTLNIVDDYTRECLAIEVDTSLGGVRVVRVVEELKRAADCRGRSVATTDPSS